MLETLKIGKFTLKIRAVDDLYLPAYKGSTLRGGFGRSLRRVVCAIKRRDCVDCLLRERCVYVYVFETPPPRQSERLRLYKTVPHPFIIEPPLDVRRYVPSGSSLDLGMVLIGPALEYLPYFIYAFMDMGEQGLGRERGRFTLESVVSEEAEGPTNIFLHESGSLQAPAGFPAQSFIRSRISEFQADSKICMNFLTPGRIKHADHLVEKPEFHHLVRALLRRFSSLSYFHGGETLEMDFRGLIDAANHIQRSGGESHWYDWERYSSRQKQRMSLGGFIGTLEYEGDFTPFLPLLVWGELLNLGKGVTFGLGRYRLEHLDA